jgi:hypothetical protein
MRSAEKKFVIGRHTSGGDVHWDLMFESGNVLKTWRLNIPPENIGDEPSNAEKIFDHDLKFLTYQGPVQKGRGEFCIADEGTVEIIEENPKHIRLRFNGRILIGEFNLDHIENNMWRLSLRL